MYIISAFQAKDILHAYDKRLEEAMVSLDLGLTKSSVAIKNKVMTLPDGQQIEIDLLKKVMKKDTTCFTIQDSQLSQLALFSKETNNYYKLYPTGKDTWPTLEISGVRMHVTKRFSPKEDTIEKVSYVLPCVGTVLDTCTGLGYTAILASKTADLVFTIERDEYVIELEKNNPYSQELFNNAKIKRIHADSFEEIKKFKSCYFDRIIHDPPRLALSTLLYSQEFYNELFRVLNRGGKIFHYTGDPGAKRGLDIRAGITNRMSHSGFKNIKRVFNGLAADKPA